MDAMSDGAVSMDGERSAPDRWGFFDACAVVGRGVSRSADSPTSAAELLADMDRHGVAEGMGLRVIPAVAVGGDDVDEVVGLDANEVFHGTLSISC